MTRTALATVLLAVPLYAAGPRVDVSPDTAEFHIGTELVGRMHFGAKLPKPYLWPLNTPGGVSVTRAFPLGPPTKGGSIDHLHHKSAWFCHGDVIADGIEPRSKVKGVDGFNFWDELPGHSIIVCVAAVKTGDASLKMTNEWRSPDGRKILDEVRTVTLHDRDGDRLFAFDIELTASEAALTFGDTKEGSFGVRVHDELRVGEKDKVNPKSRLTNAEGKVNQAGCWGQVSAWCDYSGEVDGRAVGVAILADPANVQPTCWHARDYGLLAANPFGRAKSGFPAMKDRSDVVKLAKGERLTMRYGLLAHAGSADVVAKHYEWFVKLPR